MQVRAAEIALRLAKLQGGTLVMVVAVSKADAKAISENVLKGGIKSCFVTGDNIKEEVIAAAVKQFQDSTWNEKAYVLVATSVLSTGFDSKARHLVVAGVEHGEAATKQAVGRVRGSTGIIRVIAFSKPRINSGHNGTATIAPDDSAGRDFSDRQLWQQKVLTDDTCLRVLFFGGANCKDGDIYCSHCEHVDQCAESESWSPRPGVPGADGHDSSSSDDSSDDDAGTMPPSDGQGDEHRVVGRHSGHTDSNPEEVRRLYSARAPANNITTCGRWSAETAGKNLADVSIRTVGGGSGGYAGPERFARRADELVFNLRAAQTCFACNDVEHRDADKPFPLQCMQMLGLGGCGLCGTLGHTSSTCPLFVSLPDGICFKCLSDYCAKSRNSFVEKGLMHQADECDDKSTRKRAIGLMCTTTRGLTLLGKIGWKLGPPLAHPAAFREWLYSQAAQSEGITDTSSPWRVSVCVWHMLTALQPTGFGEKVSGLHAKGWDRLT